MLRLLLGAALVPFSTAWVSSFCPSSHGDQVTRCSRGASLWAGGGFGKKDTQPEVNQPSPKLLHLLAKT